MVNNIVGLHVHYPPITLDASFLFPHSRGSILSSPSGWGKSTSMHSTAKSGLLKHVASVSKTVVFVTQCDHFRSKPRCLIGLNWRNLDTSAGRKAGALILFRDFGAI